MSFLLDFVDGIGKEATLLSAKGEIERKYNVSLDGAWTPKELLELHKVLRQLPKRLVKDNQNLLRIGRDKKLIGGPPEAPGHSMYKPNHPKHGIMRGALVIFDKGAYTDGKFDKVQFGKSVLHELAHSLNATPPPVFGKPPYITDYANRNPKEDFTESFAEYFLHPELVKTKTPAKHKAIAEMLG